MRRNLQFNEGVEMMRAGLLARIYNLALRVCNLEIMLSPCWSMKRRGCCMADALAQVIVSVAGTYVNMGVAYEKLGDYKNALVHQQKALDIYERALGPSHVSCAVTHANIGSTYQKMGDTENAMTHLSIALPIHLESLGPKHIYVAEVKNIMGAVYNQLSNHELARQLLQDAHDIYFESLGPLHPDTLKAAHDLAEVCRLSNLG